MNTNPTRTRTEQAADPMGEYWHDRFITAARKLNAVIGPDAYAEWFAEQFPNDTANLRPWQVKAQAAEKALAQEAADA